MSNKGIWDWQVVKLVTGLSILLYILLFGYFGFTETANREAIRWSGRISFACFNLAFVANSLHQVLKNSLSFWLLMNRKYWGISFAISHWIHLGFLALLQYAFHPVFVVAKTTSLAAGILVYFFLTMMLLTSFERFANLISRKNWKRLHLIGGAWIWIIFMSTYLKRALTEPTHWMYVGLLMIVLFLRIRHWAIKEKLIFTK